MQKRLLFYLGLSLLVLSACSVPAKTQSAADPALPASSLDITAEPGTASANVTVPKNTRFDFGEATPSEQTVIEQAITDADAYFQKQGYSAGTVTVSFVIDKSKTITLGKPTAQSLVVTAGSDWGSFGKSDKYKIFAHEYYHVLQFHLSQGKSTGATMALWLKEGSAEYIARKLAEAHSYPMFASYKQQALADAHSTSLHLADLEGSEAYANFAHLYGGLGFSAVDALVTQHGEAALFEFWKDLAQSANWHSAFQSAFGLSVDAFYKDFEGSLK